MNKTTILYFTLLLLGTNSQFLRFLQSSRNSYDYSSYSCTSINENLSGKTLSSTTSDQSVVYITQSGINIVNSNLNKASGDSSNTENSEFYGVNAAVLVNGGGLTMTDGTITTAAKGANAICATNNGKVTISGTTITSTGSGSARGLHATYGGKIEANKVNISTKGGSCATLATDRGEGTVTCTECTLSTAGAGSPLIYSTGDITISKTTGTATGAQAVVIEGKNTATIKESSNLKCNAMPNRKTVDQCGVMLYQSMSGDAASGTSTFNCDKSTIEIQSSSSVYSSAPMFFITNTQAKINLEECTFKYGSGVFLKAAGTSEWGSSGSNGGVVTLTLTNQDIEGDIIVDSISSLTINLVGSSIKGKINEANTAAKLAINLDSDSKITLTGNSYYTSIVNEKTDGTNLINGTYKWTYTEEKEVKSSTNQGNGNNNNQGQSPNGQPPSGSNQGMPNGQPPSGSECPMANHQVVLIQECQADNHQVVLIQECQAGNHQVAQIKECLMVNLQVIWQMVNNQVDKMEKECLMVNLQVDLIQECQVDNHQVVQIKECQAGNHQVVQIKECRMVYLQVIWLTDSLQVVQIKECPMVNLQADLTKECQMVNHQVAQIKECQTVNLQVICKMDNLQMANQEKVSLMDRVDKIIMEIQVLMNVKKNLLKKN